MVNDQLARQWVSPLVEVPMSLLTGLVMFVLVLAVLLSKGRPAAFLVV